jgi:hypothetical protein
MAKYLPEQEHHVANYPQAREGYHHLAAKHLPEWGDQDDITTKYPPKQR